MFHHWLVCLFLCVAITALSIIGFDHDLAGFFHAFQGMQSILKVAAFRLPVLQIFGIALLVLGVLLMDGVAGPRHHAKAAIQAGIAMTLATAANAFVLKPAFGRAVPWLYFSHGDSGFHPFRAGTLFGSFPSGHAVAATALFSVLWITHPKGRPLYVLGLATLAFALLAGEYHFFSDLIAGGFVGATAGLCSVKIVDTVAARDQQPMPHFIDEAMTRALWKAVKPDKAGETPMLARVRMSQDA